MMFFYSCARLPNDKPLLTEIELAADRLSKRLLEIDPKELGISEYIQKSLSGSLRNIRGHLQLYSYLLAWALTNTQRPRDQLVFIDYGGGCGILSLLAIELGIGKVVYNDIYDVSCRDALRLGEKLQLQAHTYVHGDIDELIQHLHNNDLTADVIVSYDVIEHIYDIEKYFRKLPLLSTQALRVVFASSANSHNPWVRRKRMQFHREVEYKDREKNWGHKERDALQSYFTIRKNIASTHAPTLSENEINLLAKETRGLIKDDIEYCINDYIQTGKLSYTPNHATNTCDPYTGNWAEHLMDTTFIERTFREIGFDVSIMNGYYGFSDQWHIQVIKCILNLAISMFGRNGITLAPYYIVHAQQPAFTKTPEINPGTNT